MRLHIRLACLLALLAAAIAFGPPAVAGGDARIGKEEFALVRAVNAMRKARGLPALSLRLDLSHAARGYARRMAERKFFSHVAPEGDGPTDRVEAVGYDWGRIGETLAAGFRTPEAAARSWRDSAGHAKIIFDPKHRHVGVGFWRKPSADPKKPELERYWVLLAGDTR